MNKTIKINGVEYNLKYSIRALFLFEQITEKSFELKTTLDNYVFFYSLILAGNPDKTILNWDEFLTAIDDNPNIVKTLMEYLGEYYKSQKVFEKENPETGEKKN